MTTVIPDTPAALVGVAGTDFDQAGNNWPAKPAATDATTSPDHAAHHSNKVDAITRLEKRALALGPRVEQPSNTIITGAGAGDQTMVGWTMPAVAGGWATTKTLIHLLAAGKVDASQTGLVYTFKLKVGSTLAAGVALASFAITIAGGATTPGTNYYEFELESWVGISDVSTMTAIKPRPNTRFITDIANAAGPYTGTIHDHTVHLDRQFGNLVTFDNTATATIGYTCLVPTGGTPANNIVTTQLGLVALESI